MSLGDLVIRFIGIVLALLGFVALVAVMSTAVGITFFGIAAISNVWLALILGAAFLGVGIYIIKGGSFSL